MPTQYPFESAIMPRYLALARNRARRLVSATMHGMPTCRLTPGPLKGTLSSVTSIFGGEAMTATGAGRSRGGGSNARAG